MKKLLILYRLQAREEIMESASVLWIEACLQHSSDDLLQVVRNTCELVIVNVNRRPETSIGAANVSPKLIIFDFDFPDLNGLQYLQRINRLYWGNSRGP